MGREDEVLIENAKIIWRNFEGRAEQYNREGERYFHVVLTPKQAEDMTADGWNVKCKLPKEEGDEPLCHLKVKVSFRGRIPPRIIMISSRGRTFLDAELCKLVDIAEIEKVDLILNPFHWTVDGNKGTKAYLKTFVMTIYEDALELKYRDVPDVESPQDEGDSYDDLDE